MTTNIMPNASDIERIVMRRVRVIRLLRPLLSTSALASLVFVAALWGIGREVWVARVIADAPHQGLLPLGYFYLTAFERTRLAVQALTITTLVSLIYLARVTARNFSALLTPVRA